jgi:hypothetical protein
MPVGITTGLRAEIETMPFGDAVPVGVTTQ